MSVPCEILSPTFTLISRITPPAGAGTFHRRLVGLQRDEGILGFHGGAGLHQDLDDRHILEIADVGDSDFDQVAQRELL